MRNDLKKLYQLEILEQQQRSGLLHHDVQRNAAQHDCSHCELALRVRFFSLTHLFASDEHNKHDGLEQHLA
jgi:hypothetical protein